MMKIKKNRSDTEMLANYTEKETFENSPPEDRETKPAKKELAKEAAFLTPDLEQQIDKALLALKVNLYNKGIIDYKIKVTCEENRVLLTALPAKAESAKAPERQAAKTGPRR